MVEVQSDARDNYAAIIEIEDWAHDHGLLRTNEHWLQTALREDGRSVRVAICFRPSRQELQARDARIAARHESIRLQAIER